MSCDSAPAEIMYLRFGADELNEDEFYRLPSKMTDDLWLEIDDDFDTELVGPPDCSPRNPMAPTISLLRENGDILKQMSIFLFLAMTFANVFTS
ncbi:hypothetical protein L596_025264 [Steinernema carpocapsae]|uniref:Uncharacterized protein n=1 Tax=Steinernema carpocapsae TaxID=34508 RepID=A0A4U5M798_STECR|nr:hypothetical protein L596_025264 [Steinernema carpocapsae]